MQAVQARRCRLASNTAYAMLTQRLAAASDAAVETAAVVTDTTTTAGWRQWT